VADHPLRPATDRRLGGPLPRQLANRPRSPPVAPGPCGSPALLFQVYTQKTSCGIVPSFPGVSPTTGQVNHVLLTRSPLSGVLLPLCARLACVRHAASVHSEPGSNSPVYFPVLANFEFCFEPDSSVRQLALPRFAKRSTLRRISPRLLSKRPDKASKESRNCLLTTCFRRQLTTVSVQFSRNRRRLAAGGES
jgi:hypothetical protein